MSQKRLSPSSALLLVLFGAFTFVPLFAYLAGIRGASIENRAQAELPPLSVGAFFDPEQNEIVDAYLIGALPFRSEIVRSDARLDKALGDSPTPAVTIGEPGWLFFSETLDHPCLNEDEIDSFANAVERAERVVASTRRTLVVGIGPDKAAVYEDQVGFSSPCVAQNAKAFEQAISPRHVVARTALIEAGATSQTYFSTDTHWTPFGARVLAEQIMDRAIPGAWEGTGRLALDFEGICTTDLSRLSGDPETEWFASFAPVAPAGQADCYQPTRPAVVADPDGPTAYMGHDSFGNTLWPFIAPYFSSFVTNSSPNMLGTETAETLRLSDVIIWESVQRSAFHRVVTLDVASELVVALRDELALEPASIEWNGPQATISTPESSDDLYVVISLADGSENASVLLNGRQRQMSQEEPVLAMHATTPDTTFDVTSGEVTVQLARVPLDR